MMSINIRKMKLIPYLMSESRELRITALIGFFQQYFFLFSRKFLHRKNRIIKTVFDFTHYYTLQPTCLPQFIKNKIFLIKCEIKDSVLWISEYICFSIIPPTFKFIPYTYIFYVFIWWRKNAIKYFNRGGKKSI